MGNTQTPTTNTFQIGKYSGPIGGLVVLVRLWQHTHSPAVSTDNSSAASADETVVSADKTSLISQDVPTRSRRQPQRGCVVNGVGMSWEIKDVASADTTDVLPADTTDV